MIDDQPEFFANGILVHNCRVHHVGPFEELEDQLVSWLPGDTSPDRLDALVWALTALMVLPPAVQGMVVYDEPLSISPI